MKFPQPFFAPDGESGSAEAAPVASTPSTPDTGTAPAPQSTGATGGLRDDNSSSDSDFSIPDLAMSGEDLDEVVIPATQEPPQQTPEVKAETSQQPSPPQQQVEAPKIPEQQTGQQQQQSQEATPPTEAAPGNLAQMLQTHRDALIGELATKHFALSPAEVEALQEDAVTAVPKLLAKVHLDAVSTALNHMASLVPKMIDQHTRITAANNQAKDTFFNAWPALKGKEAEVARMAMVYRQMNPQAKLDDMIRDVGPIVMAQLKLAPQPQTNGTAPQKPAPAAFAPAVGGVAVPPSAPLPNPWAGLGMDFD